MSRTTWSSAIYMTLIRAEDNINDKCQCESEVQLKYLADVSKEGVSSSKYLKGTNLYYDVATMWSTV